MWIVSFFDHQGQRHDLARYLVRTHAEQQARKLQKLTGKRLRYVAAFEPTEGELS